jgi:hypothetical protein
MTPAIIGKWFRRKGNIVVNFPELRGKKLPYRSKYLGDVDDPFPPALVERDIYHEFKIQVKLQPTRKNGGDILREP